MQNYAEQYFATVAELMATVASQSGDAIRSAAQAIAEAIENDRDFLLFGSGHSALLAREAAGRAGGLVPALAIADVADGDGERLEGMAAIILQHYDLRPGSAIVLISNSGINPVPVEMAINCKAAGLTVIAITSLAHSRAVATRHSSNKKLYEVADIVIDTHGLPGDAALDLPGSPAKVGATSTVIGAAIIQAITAQAAALLAAKGIEPPIIVSMNLPEGDAHNRKLIERYRGRLVRHLLSTPPLSPE